MKVLMIVVALFVSMSVSAQTFVAKADGEITAIYPSGNIFPPAEGHYFESLLGLSINGVQSSVFIHNKTPYDTITNFGYAHAGDVIVFNLNVLDTGYVWSTDTSLNVDNYIHYTYAEGQETYIGFEAGYGYGDGSMDDNSAYFTNVSVMTPVPEPETYLMMLVGLGLLLARNKQYKK